MSDGIVELAKMFKDRENKEIDRWIIGTVINNNPIKVKISNYELEEEDEEIVNIIKEVKINSKVVLIPSSDYQKFLLVGEVN